MPSCACRLPCRAEDRRSSLLRARSRQLSCEPVSMAERVLQTSHRERAQQHPKERRRGESRGASAAAVAAGKTALLEILLVIILCHVELRRWSDLGDNRTTIPSALLSFILRCDRCFLLRIIMVEDGRAVLSAHVRSLPVEGRGIVILPENREQVVVGDACRIVRHLHDFSVAGAAAADVVIGWILQRSAEVSDSRRENTGDLAVCGFDSPEASRAKSCDRHS